jgi:hypothetical protein
MNSPRYAPIVAGIKAISDPNPSTTLVVCLWKNPMDTRHVSGTHAASNKAVRSFLLGLMNPKKNPNPRRSKTVKETSVES